VFAEEVCAFRSDIAEDDWRKEIVDYLENPSRKVFRKLRSKENDERSARWAVWSTSIGYRMKWVIRHTGCYWLTMLEDYFEYYKGCQDCQKFGNIKRVPASALNPIIKPWPFRGWGYRFDWPNKSSI
jgi:hypothetical protein